MEKFSYFKIGIFVISAVVIGIIGVVVLGVGTIFQKKSIVETYIDESVQGLDVGSPVKFRGVQIGRVTRIGFVRSEYRAEGHPELERLVLVRFDLFPRTFGGVRGEVDQQLKRLIERGLRVRLAQ